MKLSDLVSQARLHLPYLIGLALIVLNVLIDQGVVSIPPLELDLVNALLAASGLGILHHRQVNA